MILKRLQRFQGGAVSPLHRMLAVGNELDRLFHQALGQPIATSFDFNPGSLLEGRAPALDLYEDKNGVVVKVELPGLKKEDIAISLVDGVLAVSGTRKEDPNYNAATIRRRERALGQFGRSIRLPCRVDEGKVTAAYTDGVLTITLPKAEEAKLKHIPVNVN